MKKQCVCCEAETEICDIIWEGGGTHALEFKENVNDVCDLFPSGTLSEI